MLASTLVSFALLAFSGRALGAVVPEANAKRDTLCPGGTKAIAPYLDFIIGQPALTSVGHLSPLNADAVSTPYVRGVCGLAMCSVLGQVLRYCRYRGLPEQYCGMHDHQLDLHDHGTGGLYFRRSFEQALNPCTRRQNAQTDPGSAIGLVAPFRPNGGFPQLSRDSPKYVCLCRDAHMLTVLLPSWVYLAPTTYTEPGALPEQGYPPKPDAWVRPFCHGQPSGMLT